MIGAALQHLAWAEPPMDVPKEDLYREVKVHDPIQKGASENLIRAPSPQYRVGFSGCPGMHPHLAHPHLNTGGCFGLPEHPACWN